MEESAIHLGTNYPSRRTAIDFLVYQAQRNPAKIAFKQIESGAMITFGDLDLQARNLGKTLQHFTSPGERILLVYPSGIDYIISLFGCFYAGVVAVPVSPPSLGNLEKSLQYLRSIVFDAKPVVVLTNHSMFSFVDRIVFTEPKFDTLQWLATDGFPSTVSSGVLPKVNPSETALLLYYSDATTSGHLESVAVSHENVVKSIQAFTSAISIKSRDTVVSYLPHYLSQGLLSGILLPVFSGSTCLLIPNSQFNRDPLLWLATISKYRANISVGTDDAYCLCARMVSQEQKMELDLSSWQVALSAECEFTVETVDLFSTTFDACGFRRSSFYQYYGLKNQNILIRTTQKLRPQGTLDYDLVRIFFEVNGIKLPIHSSMRSLSCGDFQHHSGIEILISGNIGNGQENEIGEIVLSDSGSVNKYWDTKAERTEPLLFPLENHQGQKFRRTGYLGLISKKQIYIIGTTEDLVTNGQFIYFPSVIECTISSFYPRILPGRSVVISYLCDGSWEVVVFCEMLDHPISPQKSLEYVESDDQLNKLIKEIVFKKHEIMIQKIILLPFGSLPRKPDGTINRPACRQLIYSRFNEWDSE